jgi:hypothetical protein
MTDRPGVLEHRVLAAVVEVQVRVDDQVDVAGDQAETAQGVSGGDVDHLPVPDHLRRAADAGVDQGGSARVSDHEAVHRPRLGAAGGRSQVQPLDLK